MTTLETTKKGFTFDFIPRQFSHTDFMDRRAKRVLIVDNDALESEKIAACSNQLGFTSETLYTQPHVRVAILFDRPQFVFLNPVMNGELHMEVIEQLRNMSPHLNIILLVRQKELISVLNHSHMRLADGIFAKPVLIDNLKELMESLAASRGRR